MWQHMFSVPVMRTVWRRELSSSRLFFRLAGKIIIASGICIIYEEGYLSLLQLVHVLTT